MKLSIAVIILAGVTCFCMIWISILLEKIRALILELEQAYRDIDALARIMQQKPKQDDPDYWKDPDWWREEA